MVAADDKTCHESWALSLLGNDAINKVFFCVVWEYSLSKLIFFSEC